MLGAGESGVPGVKGAEVGVASGWGLRTRGCCGFRFGVDRRGERREESRDAAPEERNEERAGDAEVTEEMELSVVGAEVTQEFVGDWTADV